MTLQATDRVVQPLTIGQMVSSQARLQPDKIAARDLNRVMSYRELNARANRLANALLGLGLEAGDRVAVLAYNRIEWAEIYIAVAKAGLVAVPLNFRLTAKESLFIISHSGAAAMIVESPLLDIVDSIRTETDIAASRFIAINSPDDKSAGYQDYESLLLASRDTAVPARVDADDPWCIMYTSGTTGRPKGAIRSHRGMSMLALMTAVELKLHRQDDALLVMPMCHANSLNFFTTFIHMGGTVTIFSRKSFDPALCLRTFAETGATFTSLVPTHYSMLLDAQRESFSDEDYGRVEKLMISSAPARPDTKQAVMEMFPNSGFFELYGSTEAGWVTMLHPHEQFDKLGTVGREVVGSRPIRLLDDNGEEVADGLPGELYSCTPYGFDGYWQQPQKTLDAYRGEYLSVGDVALRDADGFIRLIDRKKNIIITGGENVYPSEVESVLGAHQQVSDVAVVGCSDPLWGERVTAAVVLHANATIGVNDLLLWSKDRLAGYKRPRDIVLLQASEMPRNATGKILHRELKARLGAGGGNDDSHTWSSD